MLCRWNHVPPQLLRQGLEERRNLLPDQARHEPIELLRLQLIEEMQGRRRGYSVEHMPWLEAVGKLQVDASGADALRELRFRDPGRGVPHQVVAGHEEELRARALRLLPPLLEARAVDDALRDDAVVEGVDRF